MIKVGVRKVFNRAVRILMLVVILLSTTLLVEGVSSVSVKKAEASTEVMNTLKSGDVIKFGQSNWKVLDPSTGLVIKNESLFNKWNFGTSRSDNFFNLSTGVGKMLNDYYISGSFPSTLFSPTDQAKLQNYSWSVGPRGSETSRRVTARVGFLTAQEWEKYSKHFNPDTGVLDTGTYSGMWTLTTSTNTTTIAVGYYSDVDASVGQDPQEGRFFNVVPALHLVPTSSVELVSTKPVDVPYQNPSYTQRVEDYQAGDVVEFGNKNWIVLDPVTRYMILEKEFSTLTFIPHHLFAPGYYSMDYSRGTASTQDIESPGYATITRMGIGFGDYMPFIENKTWEVSSYKNGVSTTLNPTQRFGLLSGTEFNKYRTLLTMNTTERPTFWLSDVYEYATYQYYGIRAYASGANYTTTTGSKESYGFTTALIRPTVYLKPNTKVKSIKVTNTAPTLSLTTPSQTVSNVDTFNDFSLSGVAGDADSDDLTLHYSVGNVLGVQDVTVPLGKAYTFNQSVVLPKTLVNGSYTVSVWVTDGKGGVSTVMTYTLTVDTVSPEAPRITSDKTVPTNSNTTVNIVYPLDATIKQYSVDGGSWLSYTGALDLSSKGTVKARGLDNYGNVSNVSTLKVDTTVKTTVSDPIITVSTIQPTNKDVVVTIVYPSNTSKKYYSLDGTTWEVYDAPVSLSNNATVTAKAVDSAGNESSEVGLVVSNISVRSVDSPLLTPSEVGVTNKDVEVSIAFPSSATKKQVKVDSGAWVDYTNPVVLSKNGTVRARGLDVAGNVSSESTMKVKSIDKEAPDFVVTGIRDKGVYVQLISPKVKISDVSKTNVSYRVNGKPYYIGVPLEKGNYNLEIIVTDTAGNVSTEKMQFTIR